MSPRVDVAPAVLRWACERSGQGRAVLARRFPNLDGWLDGAARPTLKQLERFAQATHTPVGALFLAAPPDERVPIADLRTMGSTPLARPSADLLDAVYLCQRRQDWYREHARASGERPLPFVGSARLAGATVAAAGAMRAALGLDAEAAGARRTALETLRLLITRADDLGVLVMVSGIVGANTHRKLDPEEFRGFALVDDLAPVVFVNGADAKAAQLFTMAHELAHVWLGESALSDVPAAVAPTAGIERWCNAVAAELLVPLAALRRELAPARALPEEIDRLRGVFGVSALVIIRRLHDAGVLSREAMWQLYQAEVARLAGLASKRSGGNFYPTLQARVSRRFARAVCVSTWEGRSSFSEAFRLLDIKSTATFRTLGQTLGVLL